MNIEFERKKGLHDISAPKRCDIIKKECGNICRII